jgi:hypothetical protein
MKYNKREVTVSVMLFETDKNSIKYEQAFVQSKIINCDWIVEAMKPTLIAPSDLDSIIHISVEESISSHKYIKDKFLVFEFKTEGVKMPNGQRKMLMALANQKDFEVVMVEHKARDVNKRPIRSTWYYDAENIETFEGIESSQNAVNKWAKKHGRIK